VKHARGQLNILNAYEELGSYRAAAAVARRFKAGGMSWFRRGVSALVRLRLLRDGTAASDHPMFTTGVGGASWGRWRAVGGRSDGADERDAHRTCRTAAKARLRGPPW
jgi:hypothetical protein